MLQVGSSMHSRRSDGMASYIRKGARPKFPYTSLNPQASISVPPPLQQDVFLTLQSSASLLVAPSVMPNLMQQQVALPIFASQPKPTISQGSQMFQQMLQPLQSQNQTAGLYDLLQQHNDITALLVQMQTSQLLPRREIPTFDGDPLQFNTFMKAFEHCVKAKTSCKGDCLYYLEQFTRGQPRDIVRSCLHMTADKGFAVAKRLLKEHFGNEFKITAAYMEKVTGWPSIKAEDPKALKAYGLFLRECSNAMDDPKYLEELNMPANMKILSQKLPYKIRDRWRTKACEILEKTGQRARFLDIVKFIEHQVRINSDPVFGDIQDTSLVIKRVIKANKLQVKPQLRRNSFATQVVIEEGCKAHIHKIEDDYSKPNGGKKEKAQGKFISFNKTDTNVCLYCNAGGHVLEQCFKLGKRTHREKLDYLKEKGLCFSCLCTGHLSKNCDRRITCKRCNRTHPSVLHIGEKDSVTRKDGEHTENTEQSKTSNSCTTPSACGLTGAGHCNGILTILPVEVKCSKGNKIIETHAFLDPGSTGTFCTRKLIEKLNMEGRKINIHLRTLGHNSIVESSVVDSLEISGFTNECFYSLPKVCTQTEMPVSTAKIVSEKELRKWPYLKSVKIPHVDADVDLLIGTNASKLMEPWEVINSREGEEGPYAIRTLLGWVINGPLRGNGNCKNDYPSVYANRIAIDRIEELLTSQYNYDFNEQASAEQEEMSREEKKFTELMESSAQLQNGHYAFQLPFKGKDVSMPNNLSVAIQRVHGLKRRLQKDKDFHEEYKNFLADVINNGYAEEVPQHQLETPIGKVWYIPHHGVYHPRKGKLRVVFDCGAEYKGVSLNSQLLQGPNLTSSLVGVLLRFRQEQVAIMADIKAMFHQVKVAEEHRDYLRFLWWPQGKLEEDLVEHRMTVHLFGAVSSPSVACLALRKTAEDNHVNFPKEVIETINRNFYMDDLLKSLPSVENAVTMVKNLITICKRGGFTLTQWISNSREVLQAIPEDFQSKNLHELDLDRDKLPLDRALGLQWCIETDTFKFKLKLKEKPPTKRGMLSIISSVYDPLGFLAPLLLPAKLLLQELCRKKCDWDDPIPPDFQQKWNKWLMDLENVAYFKIQRCVKPEGFGSMVSAQLHHFADASEHGYGTASYLRMQNMEERVYVAFLFGKSRVAPLKPVTIPRLELTAAVVAVRVDKMLQSELQLPLKKACFWTDSTSVLKYIKNEDRRFQTFVANRVTTIRDNSEVEQ